MWPRSAPSRTRSGVLTIVDCVSSLGGIEFRTDDWQIDIAVAAAQKCLGGPPGITLMTVSDAAWERIRANPRAPRGVLPLDARLEGAVDRRRASSRSRRRSSTCTASRPAATCVLAEGLDASIARHELAARLRGPGVRAMGLELWPRSDEVTAACVTAIAVPDGLTDVQVRVALPRALRRDDLRRAGSGQPRPHRPHGADRAARSTPSSGWLALGRTFADLGVSVKIGDGARGGARGALADVPVDRG